MRAILLMVFGREGHGNMEAPVFFFYLIRKLLWVTQVQVNILLDKYQLVGSEV